MVAHHADLLVRPLGHEAVAPQQAADALLPGGIALLLPEFHLLGAVVQHHHLPDADEIADGVHLFPHLHGDLPVADVHGDGHALERHIQVQSGGLAAAQMLVHRLHPRPPVHAHRRQHVAAVQPVVLYAQHRQILRRQAAVVRPHGRGAQDHDVPRLQPAGRVGVNAVVEQAEALLGLLVDMGHDALPVHGEHGVGGRIHDILQYIHFSSPLLPVFAVVLILFHVFLVLS